MKPQKSILTALLLFLALAATAQQGINYKALIKDGSGNVVANQSVTLQFIIYEGSTLTNNVYQENHTVNTDANGIVIVNIGEGVTSDIFVNVNWGNDQHFLNVQINTGSGLVDMGTTEFKTVPYALSANNVTGLEKITEGANTGWRLIGRNPANYGDIGTGATDLSYSSSASTTLGATGAGSLAMGENTTASSAVSTAMGYGTTASYYYTTAMGRETTASNWYSTAMGYLTTASGDSSTSMGNNTTASGYYTTAMGNNTIANALASTSIGRYNIGGGSTFLWNLTDPLFEIGNGTSSTPSNALTVLKNGNVGIATSNPTVKLQINGTTDAALSNGSGLFVTGNETGLNIVFDTNEIMARNNGSTSSLSLQAEGGDLIINNANYFKDNGKVGIGTSQPSSKLDVFGVIRARNNVWPTSSAGVEIAYDSSLGKGYVQSYDRGTSAWKDLVLGGFDVYPVNDNFTNLGVPANRWTAVYAVNGTIQTSDRRMKKDINNIKYGLNTLMKLRPVSYKWKKGSQDVNLGLIAQEVQKLIPEVIDVGDDKDKTLGMKYTELIPVLISAIQEQQKIIEQQKTKNQQLKAELTTQNKSIENLTNRMEVLEASNQ
jgi:Chaperone of endosialidase/YadA head domain repeat (2 copies)